MTVAALSWVLSLALFVLLLASMRRVGHPIAGGLFCVAAFAMLARRTTAMAVILGITRFDELDTQWLPFIISLLLLSGVAVARTETDYRRSVGGRAPPPPQRRN